MLSEKNSKRNEGKISKHLFLINNKIRPNAKILLVDDIITTGATMHKAIELIKTLKPNKIEILIMSKTMLEIRKKK